MQWRNLGDYYYINYNFFFKYAVLKVKYKGGDSVSLDIQNFVKNTVPNDGIFVYQNAVRVVRDYFFMRYSIPFHDALRRQATAVCEEKILPEEMQTLAFFVILSAKKNFYRRQSLRDTWLPLLNKMEIDGKSVRVKYKFFLNSAGYIPNDGTTNETDILLRYEMEECNDMVLLDVKPEYPIGNQGRMALSWAANNTNARFIVKSDDDVYVRPYELMAALSRQQRAMVYMGSFDYSGKVSKDESSAHHINFIQEVFPPYARGALIAFSIDLVRFMATYDQKQLLKRVPIGQWIQNVVPKKHIQIIVGVLCTTIVGLYIM